MEHRPDEQAAGIASAVPAALAVDRVRKVYADEATPAVDDVSFDVAEGEFLALLGPSGSGKTTTLAMVAGLTEPTSGDIRVGGASITGTPPDRRGIGVVFQNYALFPHMTVEANIGFPLQMRRTPRREAAGMVAEALQLVGLQAFGSRLPSELSGGQQQRVAVARALVFRPRLLLMDEPLGALDKHLREAMQGEIRRIHRDVGVTVLYVTHDQREALTMAHRLAVMRDGRIEQIGTPAELYGDPSSRFVATFLGDCNLIPVESHTRDGDGWSVSCSGSRGVVSGHGPEAGTGPMLMVRPHHLRIEAPSSDGPSGRVTEVVFVGSDTEVTVSLTSGASVHARVPLDPETSPPALGEDVAVGWSWSAARLV